MLRWLADVLDADVLGIRYVDGRTGYDWEERILRGRPVPLSSTRAFPFGASVWLLDGGSDTERKHGALLDLLAEQWLLQAGAGPGGAGTWGRAPRKKPRPAGFEDPVHRQWIAVSRPSRVVLGLLPKICESRRPLLLMGENGSGRSHLAALVHRNGIDPSMPFREPADGEEPAAEIRGGTLFVPDWGDASCESRLSWLRAPARVIAASRSGIRGEEIRREWEELTAGEGLILAVPSLRERREDIPLLAGEFLKREAAQAGRNAPPLTAAAIDMLSAYSWPGNARELKEAMIRSLAGAEDEIGPDQLPPAIRGARNRAPDRPFPEKLIDLEYRALKEELTRQKGNMTRTAHAMGLTLRQVSWRVRKYGIDPREFKPHRRNAAEI